MVISRRHLFSSRRIRFRIMAEHYFPCRIPMERTLISRLLFASRVKLRDGDNHYLLKRQLRYSCGTKRRRVLVNKFPPRKGETFGVGQGFHCTTLRPWSPSRLSLGQYFVFCHVSPRLVLEDHVQKSCLFLLFFLFEGQAPQNHMIEKDGGNWINTSSKIKEGPKSLII